MTLLLPRGSCVGASLHPHQVAYDNSFGRNGCSRFGDRCHRYRCDFTGSMLYRGTTLWKLVCRYSGRTIRYLYRQGGE